MHGKFVQVTKKRYLLPDIHESASNSFHLNISKQAYQEHRRIVRYR